MVAVLTAAGSGSRLGLDVPKALVELCGTTLVARAAAALAATGELARLVVTVPAGTATHVTSVVQTALGPLDVEVTVVEGGASRQQSVAAGLGVLGDVPDDAVVLVHDAARPLVPREVVERVVGAVRDGHHAVVPGVALTDTVKIVQGPAAPGDPARVSLTPDRSLLRAVQTPQGFRMGVLRQAHEAGAARAGDEVTAATDDAALVEALGQDVWVVDGHPAAAKITTVEDLAAAVRRIEERP